MNKLWLPASFWAAQPSGKIMRLDSAKLLSTDHNALKLNINIIDKDVCESALAIIIADYVRHGVPFEAAQEVICYVLIDNNLEISTCPSWLDAMDDVIVDIVGNVIFLSDEHPHLSTIKRTLTAIYLRRQ